MASVAEPVSSSGSTRNPWAFVPILYFLQGVPVVMVQELSGTLFTKMAIGTAAIGLWTSLLKLPWSFKPLWGPMVDLNFTKRKWVVAMQGAIFLVLLLAALTMKSSGFFSLIIIAFMAVAFLSATHDIACDGFYLLALNKKQQAAFVGVTSTFFRLARIAVTGGLVYLAGSIERRSGDIPYSWMIAILAGAGLYGILAVINLVAMPKPAVDVEGGARGGDSKVPFVEAIVSYFRQDRILAILAFILLYRFGEAMVTTMAAPFMLKPTAEGALGLSTKTQGLIWGTVGAASLVLGGLVGGYIISKRGIKRTIWPMVITMHAPLIGYIWLSFVRPASPLDALMTTTDTTTIAQTIAAIFTDPVSLVVAVDMFGYGFGFAAFMVLVMYFSQGSRYQTSHYAISTGLMAFGILGAGALSGYLVESVGYGWFFIAATLLTVPGMLTLFFVPLGRVEVDAAVLPPPDPIDAE